MVIEKEIIEYLIGCSIPLVETNVYAEVPDRMPERYVLVEKTSSGREDLIDRALIAIQSISRNSLEEAMDINEIVKEKILSMPDTRNISSCTLNSDYNYTNTETKEYRYQAVFNFYY